MIPEAAVEAAARALFEADTNGGLIHPLAAYMEPARLALEAAASYMLADLRAELVKLAKEFDTTTDGTLAYTATDGRFQMRKNAHDQLMYIVDIHIGAAK